MPGLVTLDKSNPRQDSAGPKPTPRPSDSDEEDDANKPIPRHRFLSPAEWAILARGVGAVKDPDTERQWHSPIHPSSWWWPPRGMVPGLYRSVVLERTKSFYLFHVASISR